MRHSAACTGARVVAFRAKRRSKVPNIRTMKAAVVEKFGEPLVVREVPIPTPGPGQALVEVFATGVCHTDLHAVDGDWPVKPMMPLIPGHEGRSEEHTSELQSPQ